MLTFNPIKLTIKINYNRWSPLNHQIIQNDILWIAFAGQWNRFLSFSFILNFPPFQFTQPCINTVWFTGYYYIHSEHESGPISSSNHGLVIIRSYCGCFQHHALSCDFSALIVFIPWLVKAFGSILCTCSSADGFALFHRTYDGWLKGFLSPSHNIPALLSNLLSDTWNNK